VGPKLHLQIAHLLNRPLHLSKQPFELDHIGELRVDMLMIDVVLLDVFLDDVLVAEYSELLLKRGLLFLGDVELD
jgi:hypothetical protein